ncbi:MAG: hypothetical protein AAF804_10440, partial [Bacteroidota bacterium]
FNPTSYYTSDLTRISRTWQSDSLSLELSCFPYFVEYADDSCGEASPLLEDFTPVDLIAISLRDRSDTMGVISGMGSRPQNFSDFGHGGTYVEDLRELANPNLLPSVRVWREVRDTTLFGESYARIYMPTSDASPDFAPYYSPTAGLVAFGRKGQLFVLQ